MLSKKILTDKISKIIPIYDFQLKENKYLWTETYTLVYRDYDRLTIEEIQSGCGALLLSGYCSLLHVIETEKLEEIIKVFIQHYNRTIITTLGDSKTSDYGSLEDAEILLEKIGFKKIATYENKQHRNDNHLQNLWIYIM